MLKVTSFYQLSAVVFVQLAVADQYLKVLSLDACQSDDYRYNHCQGQSQTVFPAKPHTHPAYEDEGHFFLQWAQPYSMTWQADGAFASNVTWDISGSDSIYWTKEIPRDFSFAFSFEGIAQEMADESMRSPGGKNYTVDAIRAHALSSHNRFIITQPTNPHWSNKSAGLLSDSESRFSIIDDETFTQLSNEISRVFATKDQSDRLLSESSRKWKLGVGIGVGIGAPLLMAVMYLAGRTHGKRQLLQAEPPKYSLQNPHH